MTASRASTVGRPGRNRVRSVAPSRLALVCASVVARQSRAGRGLSGLSRESDRTVVSERARRRPSPGRAEGRHQAPARHGLRYGSQPGANYDTSWRQRGQLRLDHRTRADLLSISLGAAGSLSQTFDRAGRVISEGRSLTGISGDAGGGTQSFFYDNLSRLGSSSGPSTTSRGYQYDLDGNRTQRVENSVTTGFTYDRADTAINQTIGATTKTFTYDRYGNLTQAPDANSAYSTYAFDEANRLTGITPPTGGAVTFTIDPLDRHATRLVGGSTSDNYGYVGAAETAWQTGNATTTSALLDGDGTRLAIKTGAGSVAWLIFDLHGSAVALCTAGTSTITDASRYDGYGERIAASGASLNPWQYRGLLNIGSDALTWALLDMGARDYAPQLGTFTQGDSVQGSAANPLSLNRYLYALANPATLIDPDGHKACEMDPCNEGDTAHDYPNGTPPKIVPKHKNTNTSCTTPGCGKKTNTGGGGGGGGGGPAQQGPEPIPPWVFANDDLFNDFLLDVDHRCIARDQAACELQARLRDAQWSSQDAYCLTHRAECEAYQASKWDWVGQGVNVVVVVGGGIIVCALACPVLAAAASTAAASIGAGSVGGAASALTTFEAGAATASLAEYGCAAIFGACFGNESGVPSAPGIPLVELESLTAAERAAILETRPNLSAGSVPSWITNPQKQWGRAFENRGGPLPGGSRTSSPYAEFRLPPGLGSTEGNTYRLVVNRYSGDVYYSWNHYGDIPNSGPAFVEIVGG